MFAAPAPECAPVTEPGYPSLIGNASASIDAFEAWSLRFGIDFSMQFDLNYASPVGGESAKHQTEWHHNGEQGTSLVRGRAFRCV